MKTVLAFTWDNEAQRVTIGPQPDTFATWLRSAIVMSLFTNAKAEADEIDDQEELGGYWGDMDLPEGESLGSKLWLLKRRKLTTDTINKARDYCQQALQWLIDDTYLPAITIEVERFNNQTLAYVINCQLPDGTWQPFVMEHSVYGLQ